MYNDVFTEVINLNVGGLCRHLWKKFNSKQPPTYFLRTDHTNSIYLKEAKNYNTCFMDYSTLSIVNNQGLGLSFDVLTELEGHLLLCIAFGSSISLLVIVST